GTAMKRKTYADLVFDFGNVVFFAFVLAIVIYPLYFILISSFSDPDAINNGEVWLWPVGLTWEGYRAIFQESTIWVGYKNSIIYAVVGAAISTAVTISGGYALSRKDLKGRTPITL